MPAWSVVFVLVVGRGGRRLGLEAPLGRAGVVALVGG